MTDQTTETARALLYRHGLPEEVIDGALCLHAQELAAEIREETRRLKEHGVLEPWKYRPCRDAANQIDPARNEDDVAPDEAAAPLPSADQTTSALAETIESLSDTLYDALYAITPFAEKHFADEREGLRNAVRAVLEQAAVLSATTNHDTDTAPAATCSAQYHGPGEDRARLCIRAAQHERTAHTDEHGFHWSDTVTMYPVADGTFRIGTDVRAPLRRVADETAATETQAAIDLPTLAGALDGLHTLIATSSRDWGVYRVDAWIWAVICGWDCEQTEHDDTCTDGALEEMAEQHGWDDATVAKARRYRASVRALVEAHEPAAGARQDGARR